MSFTTINYTVYWKCPDCGAVYPEYAIDGKCPDCDYEITQAEYDTLEPPETIGF